MLSRDVVKFILQNAVANVVFTKTDGTRRVVMCTLKPDELPPIDDTDEPKKVRKPNLNVLPVWDLDEGAWKSFRIDSVETISIHKEYN
jgi:hypothetical protein